MVATTANNQSAQGSFDITPNIAGVDLAGYGTPYPFLASVNNCHWGDTFTTTFSVANLGSAGFSGSFNIGFYLSRDTTITNSDDYRVSRVTWNTSIPANTACGASLQISLPSICPFTNNPPPTNFYLAMWVDCDNTAGDVNPSNNKNQGANIDRTSSLITITTPIPRITAYSSTAPYTNSSVVFSNVVNDGLGGAVGIQTVTIVDSGSANLLISGVSLTGSTNFSIVSIADTYASTFVDPASLPQHPWPITPSASRENWVITLQFDPTVNSPVTGILNITNNDPNKPVLSISLAGTGIAAPQIALSTPATSINFGGQVVDGAGGFQMTKDILIQNNGSGPLTVSKNGVSLSTGTQFKINSIVSSAQGTINLASGTATIAASRAETWDIKITFDPLVLGVLNDGLKILSNDSNNPTFTVPLVGQGSSPAQLAVSDSQGIIGSRTETFPGLDATGQQRAATNITLQNTGGVPLFVPINGLLFSSGTQFSVSNVASSVSGAINLATNSAQIGTNEIWTVTLVFNPTASGTLNDTLSISASNLLSQTTFVAATVPVSGQGLVRPSLVASNSLSPSNALTMNFGNVLNDGAGGAVGTATLTLKNQGTQTLIVIQNGLTISGGVGFSVATIISSTRGNINLAAGSSTIAPNNGEFWTVTVKFDPTTSGSIGATLAIASNDPQSPAQIALSGTGVTPSITLNTPSAPLHVSAGGVYNFTWQTTYPLSSATISLYLDTDMNPVSGLVPIATGLPIASGNSYAWHVGPTFVGGPYYVYAKLTDGSVSSGGYAPSTLQIDTLGSFQFLSSLVVTNANYSFQWVYQGVTNTSSAPLAMGANVVNVTNATAVNQFVITRVATLAQVDAVQYNPLNQISTATNGNGIVTTLTYDPLGRLIQGSANNGAVVKYGYDPLGNRTNMTDYTGTTFYQYDDLNRLTNIVYSKNNILGDGDDLALCYEYDLAGRRTAIVYPGGERIQYTNDIAGRITGVYNVTRNLPFQYSYNPVTGQLMTLTRPNGIETDYSYNGMGRVTNLLHKVTRTGALVAQYNYVLDPMGKAQLLTTTLPGGITKLEQYLYDSFDRLTNVVYGDYGVINNTALSVSYSYDGNGNRMTMTTRTNNAVTEIRGYVYGSENRLLTVSNQNGVLLDSYNYDSAGNRIRKVATNNVVGYGYDERNLLTRYVDNTNQISYTYNGNAQRVSKTLNGALTTFTIDPMRALYEVVQERNASGTVTASHTFGIARLATWNGSTVTYELTDRLGSVRIVTDINGGVVQSNNFDVSGNSR